MPTQLKDGSFSAWHLSENRADSQRILAELRHTDPVHDDPAGQCWMLTRYRDVVSVLHHGQFVSRRLMQLVRRWRGSRPRSRLRRFSAAFPSFTSRRGVYLRSTEVSELRTRRGDRWYVSPLLAHCGGDFPTFRELSIVVF